MLVRITLLSVFIMLVLVLFVATLGCCTYSAGSWNGKMSDHFDGSRFLNQESGGEKGLGDVLNWRIKRDPPTWRMVTDTQPGPPPPRRVEGNRIRVTFINHSTFLIQMDGVNILTDPIWSERASPIGWAGPKRVRPAGIRFEDLPELDAVLISHNHYDHMDLESLRRIQRINPVAIYVGLGNQAYLDTEGISGSRDMDWWQTERLDSGIRLTFVPARHFSSRGLCDRNATLWGGFVIQGEAGQVFFAGDTGFGKQFAQIRKRFGPMDVSILPIGAFLPRWFMQAMHMSPAESVKAHRILESSVSVAAHFGTFPLADDAQDQPVRELKQALRAVAIPEERFPALDFGEGLDVIIHPHSGTDPLADLRRPTDGDRLPSP